MREVLRRIHDFEPTNALTSVVPLSTAALRVLSRAGFALPAILASATGERHRAVRRIVAAFFTPAKVAALRPRVSELTDARCRVAVDALSHGPVDLADMVGRHIPPLIMQELTGTGCPDLRTLKRWSRDSLELFWGRPDAQRQLELAHSAVELYAWLREDVEAHRGDDSLFGTLHAAGLTTTEICSLGYFLVIAGQETTSQLINIAFYRAVADGDAWRRVAAGASATPFVRGVLACESSVPTWRRAVPRDTQLASTQLPAGAQILLELSGHHPEPTNETAYSLAFGHGPHRCLGAKLAELEAVTVLERTACALPALDLDGADPEWIRLLSFQTPGAVTVRRKPS